MISELHQVQAVREYRQVSSSPNDMVVRSDSSSKLLTAYSVIDGAEIA
jgi:hypothetical protein